MYMNIYVSVHDLKASKLGVDLINITHYPVSNIYFKMPEIDQNNFTYFKNPRLSASTCQAGLSIKIVVMQTKP
jgi:hypothetical protein